MHWLFLFLLAGQTVYSTAALANPNEPHPVPAKAQLTGLNVEEATALITKLKDGQRRLGAGDFVPFELLAGSIASYDITKSSPRDVFLRVPFDEVWDIKRVPTDNPLWQPYRLAYSPNGLGQLYWDIEVVLGVNGDIERVMMDYKPPAPF
nr:hypothetical protein [uncultured Sphingomonas sp.]